MSTIVEFASLSKKYPVKDTTITALDNINLIVTQGDIFGIIGLSGAGKSTLIRCLARLIAPSSGAIFFKGEDIGHMEGRELRDFHKKIGMIFQHFNLLSSRTAAGNIAYPLELAHFSREEKQRRVEELLKLVGLSNKKDVYPAHLSGGEKQRVGIARALALNPELLLCDEATSALDPKTTREILDLLKKINQTSGLTIVLITHQMEVIKRICNKVAVIEQGKIVEEGLVSEIFAEPKHPTTQHFLQSASHEIPLEFYKEVSPRRKLLRLRFKGKAAKEPIISQMVRRFNVEANILLGWIDKLQAMTIGTLIIELLGESEDIQKALLYLEEKNVQCEILENE